MPTHRDTLIDELPKQYDHLAAQQKWYPYWEQQGYFHAEPDSEREPYTIVIPPPNVTGALHLGHALNNTLQDILIRFKRMQGYNTLWMPGTDHAGIATQAVVERRLREEEGKTRHDLGREALVERIWQWKEQYETRILEQLKQMGCSCDWQRTRFTLDPVCAKAVRHTFYSLFKEQLIYRGKRLVNWDTFLQTAVSDDEVFHEEVDGHFWHFKYPVIDHQPGEPTHVSIATTRPETMLGDTAVAVHPDPARALAKVEAVLTEKLATASEKEIPDIEAQLENVRQRRENRLAELELLRDMALDGRKVTLPLMEREIPLITDEWAKPELGSGCVKITPGHDRNDHDVWQRHPEIGVIDILNPDGTLNENAGDYKGQPAGKARKKVIADLAADPRNLFDREKDVEPRKIDLAHSDRSKTPIEPMRADQWFVRMDNLSQLAMDAVTDGSVNIVPERYSKTYLSWLGEKRDWCISRNLWWGHRIPVWTANFLRRELSGLQSTSAIQKKNAELRDKLQSVLDQLGELLNRPGDYCVAKDVEGSSSRCFVCVRSEEAQKDLEDFARSLPSFEKRRGTDKDQVFLFSALDPRHVVFEQLKNIISDLEQDPDVLDTWFSSALWPHSTLGWPERTPELGYFYPTSVLVTSRDIITLWVARMILTGLHNMGEVPFREVYIHPKILDGYGETMSKSKGNGVDPLDVIEKFGADSLRFGIAHLATENQDARLPVEFVCPHCDSSVEQTKKNRVLPVVPCPKCKEPFSTQWASSEEDKAVLRGSVTSERFELGRNFCNKLWNASRFALMNLADYSAERVADDDLQIEDRWILSRLATVTTSVTEALDKYRYADAARTLYDFAWEEFCSFYIEMVKARFDDAAQAPVARRVLAHTLDTLLRLLHPMIPFITEEVWHLLGEIAPQRGLEPASAADSIMIAPWPTSNPAHQDGEIESRFACFQAVLGGVREIRSRQNIPPRQQIEFSVRCDRPTAELLRPLQPYFASMAAAQAIAWGPDTAAPPISSNTSLPGIEIFVDLTELIDVDAEKARSEKERVRLTGAVRGKEKKLSNEQFVQRAPAEVVQKERASLEELRAQLVSIEATLENLRNR